MAAALAFAITVAASAIPSTPAQAADALIEICERAPQVLRCFHPSAKYVTCEPTANNRARIYSKGALSGFAYLIEIEREMRAGDRAVRLVPRADTHPLPPRRLCPFAHWHLTGADARPISRRDE